MKYFLVNPLLTFCIVSFNGLTTQAQNDSANIKVICTNFEDQSLGGEQIWFVDKSTNELYKGTTDNLGQFEIKLKGNSTYMIQVKNVGTALDYTEMAIPKLGEGESFGTFEVFVKIQPETEFILENVYYETGLSDIKSSSHKELNELVRLMQSKETIEIEIGGHTDNEGSDESNMILSQKRAESVKNYLIKKGILGNRITAHGYGENVPIASNDSESGRRSNRRTEVKIIKN